jgi:hypothetical protein
MARTALLTIAILFAACTASTATTITSSPSATSGLVNDNPLCRGVHLSADRQLKYLAVYSWQPHDNGYRPVATGLTGSMAASSRIAPLSQLERIANDFANDNYVVLQFSGDGATLLRDITKTAAASIRVGVPITPDDEIGIFLGLTDSDIAAWSSLEPTLMQPVAGGGKLVSNPAVVEAVTTGELMIFVGPDLETGCSLTATSP